jgi:hypothetical protein
MRMVYLNHFFEEKLNNINERNPSKLNFGRFQYATTMVYLNEYCLFILEQYFNNEYFFAMDYQMIDKLNPNNLQKLRNEPNVPQKKAELLQKLIGNFPKFMMEKKYGRYFFTGGTTYINLFEHKKIQEWIISLPEDIKKKMKISEIETMAIQADMLYMLFKEMKILNF